MSPAACWRHSYILPTSTLPHLKAMCVLVRRKGKRKPYTPAGKRAQVWD